MWESLFSTVSDLATSVVSGIGDAFSGIGDLFGGGYAELAPFSSMSGPEIFGGAAEMAGMGGDVTANLLKTGGSLAEFGSALGVSASDIFNMGAGTLDMFGNILGAGDQGSAIANYLGQSSKQVQDAIKGTPQGQAAEAAKKLASGGSQKQGAAKQTGSAGGAGGFKVPTAQKLSDIAGATRGMMPTPSLRPGKTARATDYMPKLAARNVTAAKYIMHYAKVAGTTPASFKLGGF